MKRLPKDTKSWSDKSCVDQILELLAEYRNDFKRGLNGEAPVKGKGKKKKGC